MAITIITDGSCLKNPGGPGGWACILQGEAETVISGREEVTTNNRMEMTAAIKGLQCLGDKPTDVTLITDSNYLKLGCTQWMAKWKTNGWMAGSKHDKHAVLNQDLWKELDRLIQFHRVTWVWVRGHAEHKDNNRCDELAAAAARGAYNGI